MINLISRKILHHHIEVDSHLNESLKFIINRQIGTSTAIALETIATAIKNPNKWIMVKDHIDKFQADRYLFEKIQKMVEVLDLQYFCYKADNTGCYIRSDHCIEI